jgi:hypothetical protein
MQRATLVTAFVAALVFGVAGWFVGAKSAKVGILKHDHKSQDCRGRDCDAKIKVDCVDPANPSAATCEPYAVEEVLRVSNGKKIMFEIADPGYEFDTDGIKFASSSFVCTPNGPRKYKCEVDAATTPDVYKYSIKLKNLDRVDPWVVNL